MVNQQTTSHGARQSVFTRGENIKAIALDEHNTFLTAMGLEPMSERVQAGKFGILFPALPAYSPPAEAIKKLSETMKEDSENENGDNKNIPLGFAFLGQFIDHDLTLEPVSKFDEKVDPTALVNFRTPALDLDNVYGSNPDVARHLYDTYGFDNNGERNNVPGSEHRFPFRLLTQDETISIDLQRNVQGTAIIGDPRNDENIFISQLHRRIIGFHNEVVKCLQAEIKANNLLYEEARKQVTLHYHWVILNEFLPLIIGKKMTDDILRNGRKFYKYEENDNWPFIPVEFSGAAYRFGHTLIRANYNLNDKVKGLGLFNVPFFGVLAPIKLSGIPKELSIDYKYFLDYGDNKDKIQFCRKVDSRIAAPLFTLPFIGPDKKERVIPSLPERNMNRGVTLKLPSGQKVAAKMKEKLSHITIYTNKELGVDNIEGLNGEAPLWFYILKESEIEKGNNGEHLGAVGGRIVGEVLIGAMEATQKVLFPDVDFKKWKPRFGTKGKFTLKDLVEFKCA